MKNIKCSNCGLTNWSKSGFCLRCKSSLKNSTSPNIGKKPVETRFPHDYLTVFKRFPHNLICAGCLCLIIFVLLYQFTKPKEITNFPTEPQQSSEVKPLSKDDSTHTPEELGVRSIDERMINRDSMDKFNSGGVTQGSDIFEVSYKDVTRPDYRKVEENADACSNKASGSQIKNISYEKVKDEVFALIEVDVEGYDCLNKRDVTFRNRLSYLWKKNDYGQYHEWVKVSDNYYMDRIHEKEEAQKIIQEKAKAEDKEKAKKLREQKARLEKELEQFRK